MLASLSEAPMPSLVVAAQAPPPVATATVAGLAGPSSSGVEEGGEATAEGELAKGSKKNAWTPEEDAMLIRVISEQGHGHWTKVADHLPGRAGRQCRERWFNHLAPTVKKGDWSKEEDEMIVAAVREHGTKWSTIQKLLPGRSDNSIKNRYYSAIRKAQRLGRRAVSAGLTVTECEATQTESSQPSPAGSSPAKSTTGATTVGADVAAAGIDMRHAHPSDASWEASKTPQSAQGSPLGGKRKQRTGESGGIDGPSPLLPSVMAEAIVSTDPDEVVVVATEGVVQVAQPGGMATAKCELAPAAAQHVAQPVVQLAMPQAFQPVVHTAAQPLVQPCLEVECLPAPEPPVAEGTVAVAQVTV